MAKHETKNRRYREDLSEVPDWLRKKKCPQRDKILSGKRILPKNLTGKEKLADVVDNAFLAYNSARLREGCRLFTEKMLEPDVTIGMTLSGALDQAFKSAYLQGGAVPSATTLVAAGVDEIGAEDPAVVITDEGVGAVPFADAHVRVEVVGQRVPGDLLPPHLRLQASDQFLGRPRHMRERRVAGIQVVEVCDLICPERTSGASGIGITGHVRVEEEPVDDQLAAAFEEVEQAHRSVRSLELVVLDDLHARHAAPLGGHRVAGPGQLLLLHQQLRAGGFPFLGCHYGWRIHHESSRLSDSFL